MQIVCGYLVSDLWRQDVCIGIAHQIDCVALLGCAQEEVGSASSFVLWDEVLVRLAHLVIGVEIVVDLVPGLVIILRGIDAATLTHLEMHTRQVVLNLISKFLAWNPTITKLLRIDLAHISSQMHLQVSLVQHPYSIS